MLDFFLFVRELCMHPARFMDLMYQIPSDLTPFDLLYTHCTLLLNDSKCHIKMGTKGGVKTPSYCNATTNDPENARAHRPSFAPPLHM